MNWTKSGLFLLLVGVAASCGIYKLNGSVIPPTVKTVSIGYFENNAPIVAPTLSPILSDKLRDIFISQTNLALVEQDGDFAISGEIVGYQVEAVNSQDNSLATTNRLTITIRTELKCPTETKLEFDERIYQFEDFDAAQNLADVEDDLIESISEKLAQEVFNKATNNW
jgi:hypothetical protein